MESEIDDDSVRFNAAVELAIQRDPAAIPTLIRGLGHEQWVIRHYHAHRALLLLGDHAIESLAALLPTTTRATAAAAHTLHKLDAQAHGDAVRDALGRALAADDPALREEAAFVLSQIGDAALPLAPLLEALLRDPSQTDRCREMSLRALDGMGRLTAETAPALLSLLRCDTWEARLHGGMALEKLGVRARGVVPDVVALLGDPVAPLESRLEAAQVLGAIGAGSKEAGAALRAALADPNPWIRIYAARALGALQPRGSARALAAALADEQVEVRRNVAYALAQFRRKALPAAPALAGILDDPVVGGVAAEALARIGAGALPYLPDSPMAAYALSLMRSPAAKARRSGLSPYVPSAADLYLPALSVELTPEKEAQFERLIARADGGVIDYDSAHPKYELLYYAVQRRSCFLHGSNRTDIEVMSPIRKSLEAEEGNPLGNINGVYATPDEVWPIFFAIVDRLNHNVSIMNGPFETKRGKLYQFALNVESLRRRPYSDGMVYLLPAATFENAGGAERASRVPVTPIAKLPVSPADFPFLDQLRGFHTRKPGWPGADPFPFLDEVAKIVARSQPK